jgi:uncharacterized protein YkwD
MFALKPALKSALALVLGAVLVAAEPAAANTPPQGQAVSTAEVSAAVRLVNAHRAAHGLGPVRSDASLTRAAADQTRAMMAAGFMSHSAGGEFGARMRAAGVRGTAAENLGVGYRDVGHAMQGWQGSSGHNANLLNPRITRIGFARSAGQGRAFYTLIMAGP